MGIFYGDIHYGIKISKKIMFEGDTVLEPTHEIIFDDNSISLNVYIDKVKNIYLTLLEPDKHRFELLVDIFTTYDGNKSFKGWQQITIEQMNNFIIGKYKIDFL